MDDHLRNEIYLYLDELKESGDMPLTLSSENLFIKLLSFKIQCIFLICPDDSRRVVRDWWKGHE